MGARIFLLYALFATLLTAQTGAITISRILEHLASQADAFRKVAPLVLSEETLEQRSRPVQQGQDAVVREVVSAYGFASLATAPNALHEVRKVISVNGKQVLSVEMAREAMTLGLNSSDDRMKKRLLENFEKHGLHGAATDFGQLILLFSAWRQKDFNFQLRGERQSGAERLLVLAYVQKSGDSGTTVFVGNARRREPLHGEISLRKKDLVPLRISTSSTQVIREIAIREESTVDYKPDPAGAILPISVVHREYVQDLLQTENTFTYTPFRKLDPGGAIQLPQI